MSQKKKKWVTPKLIVLVRGKPEERLLQACKTYGNVIGPESVPETGCTRYDSSGLHISDCNLVDGS